MPRKKTGLFDQSKYIQQYIHDNVKHIKVSLNKNKPEDMQIIAWIAQQSERASGYIKRLIREDMEKRSVVYCKDCWRRDSFDCCLHEGGYPYHDTADDWFCGDGEKKPK